MKRVTLIFCVLFLGAFLIYSVPAADDKVLNSSVEEPILHGVPIATVAEPETHITTKEVTTEPTRIPTTEETKIITPETTTAPVINVGWVMIISTPSGADVTIDGKHAGVTPISGAELTAGVPHTIDISMIGYKPFTKSITVVSREQTAVDATLEKEETPTPTKTAEPVKTGSPTASPTTAKPTQSPIGGDVGWYTFHANVDGATASFDSLSSGCTITGGTCTIPFYTTSAPYKTYTVQKPGYTIFTGDVTQWPDKGETVNLYATLNPSTTYGYIGVYSVPQGAVASLDGLTWQYTPCTFNQVTAGTNHILQVSLAGYQTYTTTVWVSANQNTPVSVTLSKNPAQAGSISIETSPKGADVYIDGQYRGYSPTTVSGLAPGSHTIRMQKAGYDEYMGTVTVYSNQVTGVSWTFSPLPPSVGSIEVTSTPAGASVFLDGNYMGATPSGDYLDLTSITAGSHTLLLQLSGYSAYSQTVTVNSGGVTTINAQLSPSGKPSGGTGEISVSSEPAGAEMYLDNTFRGITPLTISGISAGSHSVLLKMTGYADSTMSVNVAAGKLTPVAMNLAQTPAASTKSPLGVVPVFAALLGIGLLAGYSRK